MSAIVITASKHGATAEIGQLIGDVFTEAGVETTVRPAELVKDLQGYDAVVLGSAVYMGRWMESASRLVARMPDDFAASDVWLFSSGPLGDPPMPGSEPDDTEPMLDRTHAREHRTFAGRIVRDELRFGEKAITKLVGVPEGDFIPRDEIRSWASEIARTILREAEGQGPLSSGPVRPSGESRPAPAN